MRRRMLWGAALVVAAVVAATGAVVLHKPEPEPGSYGDGLGIDAHGDVVPLPAGSGTTFLPGTRVIAGDGADERLATEQRDWLAQGWLPDGDLRELVATSLLDIRLLTSAEGGITAAPSTAWRYVWPRDSSFAAAALAATGHLDEAVDALVFLQRVQEPDGSFHARYLPDGSAPPDDRGPQTDGTGWALWALDAVVAAAPAGERPGILATLDPLLQRSTAFLLAQVDNESALPPPSSDYWEHRERRTTLGTAAPVLAGLEAAARLHDRRGDSTQAEAVATAATRTRDAIADAFGSHGYPRYPQASAPDAAAAFLLPPYQPAPLPGAVDAWADSVPSMQRPGGGLAPGGGWREQRMSWTPETALYALAAAAIGDDEQARHWLTWLDEHRTPTGALPEKVGSAGNPAGPAPLAWTCALVVLTAVALED